MPSFYADNDDLKFYAEQAIDWSALDPEYDADTYRDVLSLVGELSGNEIAPRARQIDTEGTSYADGKVVVGKAHSELFEMMREMELFGIPVPRELGGMGLPEPLYWLCQEMLARGEVSCMTHLTALTGGASTLLRYSLKEGSTELNADGTVNSTRWADDITKILDGQLWCSMDLTEPNAGSDLAAIRTRARVDAAGTWKVNGTKIFISSGHANCHFVLAKTDDRDSLDALSLFRVMLVNEDGTINAHLDGIEEKVGQHGSPTCTIRYEDSVGELIGSEGQGFRLTLMMMNYARIGVGFQSIGLAESAYRLALDYAAERATMGRTIDRHPMIADYLDEMKTTIAGLRAIAVDAALCDAEARTLDRAETLAAQNGEPADANRKQRIRKLKGRARKLTPLLKYLGAEEAVRIARLGMQIHGGNGYMRDYDAERLLRDALVLPVYEGTSQIQSLMVLKDTLEEVSAHPQRFLRRMATARINSVRASDELERSFARLDAMTCSATQHLLWRVAKDKLSQVRAGPWNQAFQSLLSDWKPKRDFSYGFLHAERLTRIIADREIAATLLEQATRFPERRAVAKRWMSRAESRVRYNLDTLQTTGSDLLDELERRDELAEGGERAEGASAA